MLTYISVCRACELQNKKIFVRSNHECIKVFTDVLSHRVVAAALAEVAKLFKVMGYMINKYNCNFVILICVKAAICSMLTFRALHVYLLTTSLGTAEIFNLFQSTSFRRSSKLLEFFNSLQLVKR